MRKKLFISCPMNGRTEENIKNSMERMFRMAELIFDQELDVIDSFIEEDPPEGCNIPVWYLGKSIEKMAEADYFIGVQYNDFWKGCDIETQVARSYGIPTTFVEVREFMPDAWKLQEDAWKNSVPTCAPIG